MSINGIGSFLNAVTATQKSNTTSNATSNTTSNKSLQDTFMTLLVTQLKNQDPMEPQDGTQFVTQLAQFNSLDQLVGIKQSIDTLVKKLGD